MDYDKVHLLRMRFVTNEVCKAAADEIEALRKERGDIALLVTSTKAELQDQLTRYRVVMEQAVTALEAALSDDQPYIQRSKDAVAALRECLKDEK